MSFCVKVVGGGQLTLDSSGLKSINKVSSMILAVSTSSTSLLRELMRFLRAPDATDAGYSFAKLLSPSIAALRSSNKVALCRRPLSVEMVFSAFCFAGACDSSNLNIVLCRHPFVSPRNLYRTEAGSFKGGLAKRSEYRGHNSASSFDRKPSYFCCCMKTFEDL